MQRVHSRVHLSRPAELRWQLGRISDLPTEYVLDCDADLGKPGISKVVWIVDGVPELSSILSAPRQKRLLRCGLPFEFED